MPPPMIRIEPGKGAGVGGCSCVMTAGAERRGEESDVDGRAGATVVG